MKSLILMMALWQPFQAGAHGEDKPGPHGGYISMPGAFHVELVPEYPRRLKAYLLDVNWKSPTLKDSSVEIIYGSVKAKCEPKSEYYQCEFPLSVDLNKKGELSVNAVREKQQGAIVKYSLPFKFENKH